MPEPTSPAYRALRAAAVDEVDPGGPEAAPAIAATVVLARDAEGGPEVLMIERPDRGSFAGAWVFPGGKLDPGDRAAADEPEERVARRAGVRETREETGLVVDATGMATHSVWTPPPGARPSIRTWFFVAPAPADETLALAADEAVSAAWTRPADVLERHARGELILYPPTWVTLHEFAGQASVDDLLALSRLGGVRLFESRARRGPHGRVMLWAEDAEYDEAGAAGTARHRLTAGDVPWTYERSL
ncbi:NUDIX hydrolase [Microbacterium sp. BWT-B31]|uniref:NUDIX hydrolase n=1 Tax=Microbacterium sp. BWT-B31 TaxID=3232072 RepID=UPI00352782DB